MTVEVATFTKDLSADSDPLVGETSFGADLQIGQVMIRVDPATVQDKVTQSPTNGGLQEKISIALVSGAGPGYITQLFGGYMHGKLHFVWYPEGPCYIDAVDEIRVTVDNKYQMGTVYVSVYARSV